MRSPFSIDRHYNALFASDVSHTFPNLAEVAPFLTNQNSRLFFGTVFPNDSFDNMLVARYLSRVSMLLLAIAAMMLPSRRLPARAS
jgi:hypothetical protein